MSGPSSQMPQPTSRNLTQAEIDALTGKNQSPYVGEYERPIGAIDPDSPDSWYYPETLGNEQPTLRPQMRAYKIIGVNGQPTGKIVYANNEVQGAALRQTVRDAKQNVYLPGAVLVDIIYDDEK